jgi:SNF2 family DNA or RNA helicase
MSASSSKVETVIDELMGVPASSKVLIFSQFTRMLDILESRLIDREINYCKFTGTLNLVERHKIIGGTLL